MDFAQANERLTALRESLGAKWRDDPEYGHPHNIQQRAKSLLKTRTAIKDVKAMVQIVERMLERGGPFDEHIPDLLENRCHRLVQAVRARQWLLVGEGMEEQDHPWWKAVFGPARIFFQAGSASHAHAIAKKWSDDNDFMGKPDVVKKAEKPRDLDRRGYFVKEGPVYVEQ